MRAAEAKGEQAAVPGGDLHAQDVLHAHRFGDTRVGWVAENIFDGSRLADAATSRGVE